jgi:fermentation-respiration switch protein FrsA (DUF1100 family)
MSTTIRNFHIDIATWREPKGLKPRGTLIILTGRGETPEIYHRFGTRLAADAYKVVAVSATDHLAEGARHEIAQLLGNAEWPAPKVLIGSDAGARAALELATDPVFAVDGVITAGLPVGGPGAPVDWQNEIASRTACPVHREVLQRSARGSIWHEVSAVQLRRPAASRPEVPVLAIHGSADPISPLTEALDFYRNSQITNIKVVVGGLHDILNDLSHRSVAATVVLFLERLRASSELPVIIRDLEPVQVPVS